jgi:acyl carrier protein
MTTHEALEWVTVLFEDAPGRITTETLRSDIPGWDSLGTLTLIAGLDERFGIQLSEQDIEGMQKVDDIFEILRRNGALVAAG